MTQSRPDYYVLIRKSTNRTWAVSRRPFDPVPAHSRQERTNKSPLTIQHPAPAAKAAVPATPPASIECVLNSKPHPQEDEST